ncbi:hypothetical protein L1987_81111 [Smallanthus sonchifolius]|uniref:Uncharacterized protein n=1 Tax=Smallanthus sonchifolius TaxID=185202 RepID=A0ACB8YTS6_9ASTR|nr:hypothetical protein L1987_81111 [Smallanthus sonchifolius]
MSQEEMSLSVNVNGQSKVPPGFRFHPTEEELLHYYLRKKVAYEKIDLDVIRDVDLNKLEPWDIQEKCKIGSTPQNDWYFFSHKDKKYPTGTRTNRATAVGFWKATGRDKGSNLCDSTQEDGWVVCRVFKKKNYHKALDQSPQRSIDSRTQLQSLNKDGVLDQLLVYMSNTRSCKQELESLNSNHNTMHQSLNPITGRSSFYHLPRLENPTNFDQGLTFKPNAITDNDSHERLDNWADLERLVATQLNGQVDVTKQLYSCYEPNEDFCFPIDHEEQEPSQFCDSTTSARPNNQVYTSEIDLWSFARSSSSSTSGDPLCHLSV